jgi:hypothetical protein
MDMSMIVEAIQQQKNEWWTACFDAVRGAISEAKPALDSTQLLQELQKHRWRPDTASIVREIQGGSPNLDLHAILDAIREKTPVSPAKVWRDDGTSALSSAGDGSDKGRLLRNFKVSSCLETTVCSVHTQTEVGFAEPSAGSSICSNHVHTQTTGAVVVGKDGQARQMECQTDLSLKLDPGFVARNWRCLVCLVSFAALTIGIVVGALVDWEYTGPDEVENASATNAPATFTTATTTTTTVPQAPAVPGSSPSLARSVALAYAGCAPRGSPCGGSAPTCCLSDACEDLSHYGLGHVCISVDATR